jgi:hypothetical protein
MAQTSHAEPSQQEQTNSPSKGKPDRKNFVVAVPSANGPSDKNCGSNSHNSANAMKLLRMGI